jgi:hypothetical protein
MPTRQEHIAKAVHNESFVQTLGLTSTPFLDWVVTGMFYAAVHYVDAYLAIKNIHPKRHRAGPAQPGQQSDAGRSDYVFWHLKQIYQAYRYLDDQSREARYSPKQFASQDIQACSHSLTVVRQHLQQYISP